MLPEQYVVLDLETTGLNPGRDRILEVGAVRVEHGRITCRLEEFVNPHREIPAGITELTGITDEMILGAPEAEDILRKVRDMIGYSPIIGHNIGFDYSFLKTNAARAGLDFDASGIDTLKIAKQGLSFLPSRSLESLCGYYSIPRIRAHRALDDVLETQLLFLRLYEQFGAEHPDWFRPVPFSYKVKKESPITPAQKRYLGDLLRRYQIRPDAEIDSLTKSEASRRIDQILSNYGYLK